MHRQLFIIEVSKCAIISGQQIIASLAVRAFILDCNFELKWTLLSSL